MSSVDQRTNVALMFLAFLLFFFSYCCVSLQADNIEQIFSSPYYNEAYNFDGEGGKILLDSEVLTRPRARRSVSKKKERYLELVLVVDNVVYKAFKEDEKKIRDFCQDVINEVNAAYSVFEIRVMIVDLVIWTSPNPIKVTNDTDETLKNFKEYKDEHPVSEVPHDNIQLLIGTTFDKGNGVGSISGMCTKAGAGVVSVVQKNAHITGMIMSHELGHNFGLEHNTKDCCDGGHCIMNNVTSFSRYTSYVWSRCSKKSLEEFISSSKGSCLYNIPKEHVGVSSCGNGVLEEGEECDCGLPRVCNVTRCCDPKTCKLQSGAKCGTGRCCNTQLCQPEVATTLCRESLGDCDLKEYCDGKSEHCPADVHKQDFEKCKEGKGVCYKGTCVSHSLECQKLWGDSASSSDGACYKQNKKGNHWGNCGRIWNTDKKKRYKKCKASDESCGRLHCAAGGKRCSITEVYNMGTWYQVVPGYVNDKPCCVVEYDIWQKESLGLVPEGSRCGTNRFCINQSCVSKEDHIKCSETCNGYGVCNSKGNCHCDEGMKPPYCDLPGVGGSIDSGPINREPEPHGGIVYIIFLLAVPILVAIISVAWLVFERSKLRQEAYRVAYQESAAT